MKVLGYVIWTYCYVNGQRFRDNHYEFGNSPKRDARSRREFTDRLEDLGIEFTCSPITRGDRA